MKLLKYFKDFGFDFYFVFEDNKVIDRPILIQVENETFKFNIKSFPDGKINFKITSNNDVFSEKQFLILYDNSYKQEIKFFHDFFEPEKSSDYKNIAVLSKLNFLIAEMLSELKDDYHFHNLLATNHSSYLKRIHDEYVNNAILDGSSEAINIMTLENAFFNQYSFIDEKEISKSLKSIKNTKDYSELIYKVVDLKFNIFYFKVFYIGSDLYYCTRDSLAVIKDDQTFYKCELKNIKKTLTRAYELVF